MSKNTPDKGKNRGSSHQNKEPLDKYITRETTETAVMGASPNAFRARKKPKHKEDSQRGHYTWHVKTPAAATHNAMLHKAAFPKSQPLTAQQLADQELSVRKTLLADSLWAAFLGKENVAKTRHWYGTLDDTPAQHYIASRMEGHVKPVNQCTDAATNTPLDERPPLTQYEGKAIEGGKVNGMALTGWGRAAVLGAVLRSPDLQSGNFGLYEKDGQVKLYKFDNKYDLGADPEKFFKRFFDEQAKTAIEEECQESIALCQQNIALVQGRLDEVEADRAGAEATFNAEKAAFLAIVNDGSEPIRVRRSKMVECLKGSQSFAAIYEAYGDAIIPHIAQKTFNDSLDMLEDIKAGFEGQQAEVEAELEAIPLDPNPLMPVLKESGKLDWALQRLIFPSQENYVGALDSGMSVFNFPFKEDFATAPHVKEEFMEAAYLMTHADKGKIQQLADATLGRKHISPYTNKPVSDLVYGQLEKNITTLRKAMEHCPEYQEYVAAHQKELDAKLAQVNSILEEKATEYGSRPPIEEGSVKGQENEGWAKRALQRRASAPTLLSTGKPYTEKLKDITNNQDPEIEI